MRLVLETETGGVVAYIEEDKFEDGEGEEDYNNVIIKI